MALKGRLRAKDYVIKEDANIFIEEATTIRDVAKKIGIPKSTLHTYLTKYLPTIDEEMYFQVREIIDINTSERHLRGGLVTKSKYTGVPVKDRKKSK